MSSQMSEETFQPLPVPFAALLALLFFCLLLPFSPLSPLRLSPQSLSRVLAHAEMSIGQPLPDLLVFVPALACVLGVFLAAWLLVTPMLQPLDIRTRIGAAILLGGEIGWLLLLGVVAHRISVETGRFNVSLPYMGPFLLLLGWGLLFPQGASRVMAILLGAVWMNAIGAQILWEWSGLSMALQTRAMIHLPALLATWAIVVCLWRYQAQVRLEKEFHDRLNHSSRETDFSVSVDE